MKQATILTIAVAIIVGLWLMQQSTKPIHSKPTQSPLIVGSIFYPMTRYESRVTNRWYGKAIVAADRDPLPCGSPFVGLHVGDDLEVSPVEINQVVPVFAIADGIVRQVGGVGGYGGLLVIEHQLMGQPVTTYYGHINLGKTSVKVGDSVKAGQSLTILGDQCSSQTSGERKHLHFAIHRGTALDVHGYAQTSSELQGWIDPRATLKNLVASEPQE